MASDVSRPELGWGLIAAAAVAVAGWLAPWVYIDQIHVRLNGPHLLSLPLTCSIVLALAGLLILQRRGHTWVSVTAIVAAGLLFVFMVISVGSVCEDQAIHYELPVTAATAGYGLWLTPLGALAELFAAVVAFRRRDAAPAKLFRSGRAPR
jgi:lipopolysaccharide export LptBFGC system permease protein LptF